MEPVLKLISESQIQIAMKEHDLLYRAVQNGDLNMTQLLCKYGADINQRCRNGRWTGSPLRCALRNRNVEIATWLLENGAFRGAISLRKYEKRKYRDENAQGLAELADSYSASIE
ncbi:hypothetical protein CBL_20711 [Carabus blaptoides fortunei]